MYSPELEGFDHLDSASSPDWFSWTSWTQPDGIIMEKLEPE
jgi:hypothetical protein